MVRVYHAFFKHYYSGNKLEKEEKIVNFLFNRRIDLYSLLVIVYE